MINVPAVNCLIFLNAQLRHFYFPANTRKTPVSDVTVAIIDTGVFQFRL